MTIKPIGPYEVVGIKQQVIPDNVIDIFNRAIAKNFSGGISIVIQNSIVSQIANVMDVDRSVVFQEHWLDIEELYREQGWKVTYYKPAYNETGEAYWNFEVE